MANDSGKELERMQEELRETDDTQRVLQEVKRRQKLKELDGRVNQLCERAILFENQYGEDDYRTQILVTFLDVTLQMKSVIDVLDNVGFALECIGQAIGCVDDVLTMQEEIIAGTLDRKYGFFARMKRKRMMRRAIRNNAHRMQQMCDNLVGSQKMALELVKSLKKSSLRMQTMSQKNFSKFNKKSKGDKAPEDANAQAKQRMAQMRAEKAEAEGADGTDPVRPVSGGSAGGGSTGGIDDIA